ncbi:hypothetical protein ACOMHN_041843 [Nucella lapillus]
MVLKGSLVIEDDSRNTDQLNHWATVGLLTALAVATGAKQFVGAPIICWLPAYHKKECYQDYVNNYCWVKDMYYYPFSEPIPAEPDERYEVKLSFYRWVMVMFLLQALLFKLPNLLWQELKGYSGLNVEKMVGMVSETSMMTPKERQEQLAQAAVFMHHWLKSYTGYRFNAVHRFRQRVSGILFCFGKRTGNYLTGLYMFIKMLYLVNVFGQFFLLTAFLGVNYWNFGFDAISVLAQKGHWEDHYTFPRVALCDYEIRQMTNLQTFSVQCVLSINLFLEKIYLVVWFWMMGVFLATLINLCLWFIDNVLPWRNGSFMLRYARMMNIKGGQDRAAFRWFAENHLRRDGVFILRMVANNTSSIMCFELVRELWNVFLEDVEKQRHNGVPRKPSAVADGHPDKTEDASGM